MGKKHNKRPKRKLGASAEKIKALAVEIVSATIAGLLTAIILRILGL